MSWMRDVVQFLRTIMLIEDRIDSLAEQHKELADASSDQDLRLTRIEAQFDLLKAIAASSRKSDRGHQLSEISDREEKRKK
ncbi:MAG TPA: hypothetical protein VN830_07650 [Verrucomicrobiae bacterium]|nr:hypothetical protein [Verrucomicrobiae bacterium]